MRKKPEPKYLQGQAGRHIRQAFIKSAKEDVPFVKGLSAILPQVLMQGELGEKEFQLFKDTVNKLPEKFPEYVGLYTTFQKAKGRGQEDLHIAFFTHLALSSGIDKFIFGTNFSSLNKSPMQENFFVPLCESHIASKSQYIYESNAIPVRLNASHLSIRFKEHLKQELDIRSKSFNMMCRMALAICQSYGTRLSREDYKCYPMVIPHKKGLFVGYIEGAPPVSFTRNFYQSLRINDQFKCTGGFAHQPLPVESVITIKTFYPMKYCTGVLQDISLKMFFAFIKASINGGMKYSFDTHTCGISRATIEGKNKNEAEKLFQDLQNIFQSEEWKIMCEIQKKHAPPISSSAVVLSALHDRGATEFWQDPATLPGKRIPSSHP